MLSSTHVTNMGESSWEKFLHNERQKGFMGAKQTEFSPKIQVTPFVRAPGPPEVWEFAGKRFA